MDRLTEALGLVTAGDYGLAETLLRDILGTPELPSNVRADALGLLGSCYKFAEKYQEAQDLLEKALALGQSEGFVLSDLEGVYADALADAYTQVVNYMVNSGQMEEVNSMVKKLRQLIATYGSHSNFQTIKHQGMMLFFESVIAGREGKWDNAMDRLKQLVCSPYKEYFVSEDLKFVIGLAYSNMGRIYLTQGDYENAVQYLEESLSYYEQNSEDTKRVLKDLTKARSGKQLPSEIQKLLQDIEMGSREKKIVALQEISRVGKGHLQEVRPVLLNTMRREDAKIAWFAACALAVFGDQSEETIENLIANLDPPPSEEENIIKYATIQALSNVKNNTRVVDALIRTYQTDQNISVRLGSIWALGAIGDESSREHLEYIASRGEGKELRAAQDALELFGKGSFEEIHLRKEEFNEDEKKEITHKINKLKSEIKHLDKDRNEKFSAAGQIAYSEYVKNKPSQPPTVTAKWDEIQDIDTLIAKNKQDLNELAQREKKSGFLAKLSDTIVSTAKHGKVKLDVHNLERKKDHIITEFGSILYDLHKKGDNTLEVLSSIWQNIDDIEHQISKNEGEIAKLQKYL